MPGDPVHSAPRDRILPHPGLRPVDTHRHPVVGLVLDQRRVVAGPGLHRPAQRPHHRHTELRHQPDTPTRVVHQGDRRLDDRLPRLRILRAPRVRVRQRGDAQRRPDSHADRPECLAATDG